MSAKDMNLVMLQAEKNRAMARKLEQKKAQQEKARKEKEADDDLVIIDLDSNSDFVTIEKPKDGDEISVIDVYFGPERKHYRMPATIARHITGLLSKTSKTTTSSLPCGKDSWEHLWAYGNWDIEEDPDWMDEVTMVKGPTLMASHTTETIRLPEVGVAKFQSFVQWAKETAREFREKAEAKAKEEAAAKAKEWRDPNVPLPQWPITASSSALRMSWKTYMMAHSVEGATDDF